MLLDLIDISIHALVKRATTFYIRFKRIYPYFNPRPREEGDKCGRRSFRLEVYFNPRPREEGDRFYSLDIFNFKHFNPRPRKEGDLKQCLRHRLTIAISIHALVKRATRYSLAADMCVKISIHALVKRATKI